MNKLADYDKYNYDYSSYWTSRQYENLAEELVLDKLTKSSKGVRHIDIGGSYGRLLHTYYNNYKSTVIIDYSHKTLTANASKIHKKFPKTTLIAANAYKLPFKRNSFDGGLMVRVLHHIDNPPKYFKELNRVLASGANFTQEYANKVHIKARLRALIHTDFEAFNVKPYQQPSQGSNEGSKGEEVPFLNFHPRYMKSELREAGFTIKKHKACSFLRSTPLAAKLQKEKLLLIEKTLQSTLGWTNLTPSIFLKLSTDVGNEVITDDSDIYACPKCYHDIELVGNTAKCDKCGEKYTKRSNVWDLRVI